MFIMVSFIFSDAMYYINHFCYTIILDMFSGYHQIRVRKEDEEKTSFITPFGTFCFVRMPERLKNAGCTFSRMIATILHPQIHRNILAYVDDIVVKSVQRRDHISDLAETFANLRAANLKLNPEKCVRNSHGESPQMPSLNKRHRGESRQNQSISRNARSSLSKRCAEVDRESGRA
jgi:hypothetical protein